MAVLGWGNFVCYFDPFFLIGLVSIQITKARVAVNIDCWTWNFEDGLIRA
jgi:hypothetical protein